MYKNIFSYILIYFFCLNLNFAQEKFPFENIKIGAGYLYNFNKNEFHKYWHSVEGLSGYLQTPFYLGYIRLGLNYSYCVSIDKPAQPDFNYLVAFLDWGEEFELPLNFKISPYGKFGMAQMDFISPEMFVHEGFLIERELLLGFGVELSHKLFDEWYIFSKIDYQKVYFYPSFELTYFQIGISHKFESPNWLMEFMK
ncbi:MAG: hypothetical protein JW866_02760 [Ignavibacteriales bacterium]|nr:hypothetical protein [Ignavibacteriales bacterium]